MLSGEYLYTFQCSNRERNEGLIEIEILYMKADCKDNLDFIRLIEM